MASIVLSTLAFFLAGYFAKRYLESIDIPKGFTRGTVIFCVAALVSYGVAALVDWLTGL
jgi:VIT1/CCC1 family predicted Fe2+/Mn2+ transporter